MNIAAELRNAVMDNFAIDKRLVSDAADAIEMLGEDNGKLRELVAEMWRFGFSENSGANSVAEWNEQASAIRDRMRELGIEVS